MSRLGLKILAVIVITLGLLIPLGLIRGLIRERTEYRDQARADIARAWTGAQELTGPLLALPPDGAGPGACPGPGCRYLLPESLAIETTLESETRRRGLYAVPVYTARMTLTGQFDLSRLAGASPVARSARAPSPGHAGGSGEPLGRGGEKGRGRVLEAVVTALAGSAPLSARADAAHRVELPAVFALSISDNRGIVRPPIVEWGGEARQPKPGSVLANAPGGIRTLVGGAVPDERGRVAFRVQLELRGMESLRFVPVADDTRVVVNAAWPHPSFIGRFLPVERTIREDGFDAEWRVSGLASGRQGLVSSADAEIATLRGNAFGVALIEPVDIYQKAMRSVKYGNLVVLLTFTAFFLVEMVRRLLLHPLQYLFVGLALVIFFLLLVSLSEHLPFGTAYLAAAVACVGLIAVYSAAALGSALQAAGLSGLLGGLYGMLYAILMSEDNALLMGSLLMFFALAAVMLVTRNVDWYRIGQQVRAEAPARTPSVPDRPAP